MLHEKICNLYPGVGAEVQLPAEIYSPVPFYPNTGYTDLGDLCLVANIQSVLKYFMPDMPMPRLQVAKLCGYESGKGAWQTESMLCLNALGLKTQWIEDADLWGLATDPEDYMRRQFPDPEALKVQLANSNIYLESQRAAEYLQRGLPFDQRLGMPYDIASLLADGWLVRIPVDAAVLPGGTQPDYDPHSLLLVGYDQESVIAHDANSKTGNKYSRHISWEMLDEAWARFSRTRALNAYRL